MAKEKKKEKKMVLPDKRTMNLYYKPDKTTRPATIALYVLFALSLLLAAAKFGVYDLLMKLDDAQTELARTQAAEQQYAMQLTDYDEVLHQYHLYSATEDELNTTDRMEILDMLDELVRSRADVETYSVAGPTVTLAMSGITLGESAEIIRDLRESPLVAAASVNTAATEDSAGDNLVPEDPNMPVTATVTITLAKEAGIE